MRLNWRYKAVVSVAQSPFDETILMAEHADPQCRIEAIRRIVINFDASSARFLLHTLAEDDEPSVREAAVHGLGEVGEPSTIRYLRSIMNDDDIDVSIQAVQSIKAIETRHGLRRLAA